MKYKLSYIRQANGTETQIGDSIYLDSEQAADNESEARLTYGIGYEIGGQIADIARVEFIG